MVKKKKKSKHGWTAEDFRGEGRKTEDTWEDDYGNPTDEDGHLLMQEVVGEEVFVNWRERGKQIAKDEKNRQWMLGQWIVEGEELKQLAGNPAFKHSVYQAAAEITGHSVQTIKSLANVVRNVHEELKDEYQVSFAHLKLVANTRYTEAQQRDFLSQMERANLNVAESRARVQYLTNTRPERKPKADARVDRIIQRCRKLEEVLGSYDFNNTSPGVHEAFLLALMGTRHTIALALDDATVTEPELVSNHLKPLKK
jgi:hypothetical protein